jgi:SRSO17 transposase
MSVPVPQLPTLDAGRLCVHALVYRSTVAPINASSCVRPATCPPRRRRCVYGRWAITLFITCLRFSKGKLKARFAAVRVRTADGLPQRIRDKGQQHLPGDEAWLIGEHRASGEKKYYLANLPATTALRTLAATIKARRICEQAHQQLKEELGLDHFEGRSWQGLHRHVLMTMIAFAFLQHHRLKN